MEILQTKNQTESPNKKKTVKRKSLSQGKKALLEFSHMTRGPLLAVKSGVSNRLLLS